MAGLTAEGPFTSDFFAMVYFTSWPNIGDHSQAQPMARVTLILAVMFWEPLLGVGAAAWAAGQAVSVVFCIMPVLGTTYTHQFRAGRPAAQHRRPLRALADPSFLFPDWVSRCHN